MEYRETNIQCINNVNTEEFISIDLTELQEERLRDFLCSKFQANDSIQELLVNHNLNFSLLENDPSNVSLTISNNSNVSKVSICKLEMTKVPVTRTELLFDENRSNIGISSVVFKGI